MGGHQTTGNGCERLTPVRNWMTAPLEFNRIWNIRRQPCSKESPQVCFWVNVGRFEQSIQNKTHKTYALCTQSDAFSAISRTFRSLLCRITAQYQCFIATWHHRRWTKINIGQNHKVMLATTQMDIVFFPLFFRNSTNAIIKIGYLFSSCCRFQFTKRCATIIGSSVCKVHGEKKESTSNGKVKWIFFYCKILLNYSQEGEWQSKQMFHDILHLNWNERFILVSAAKQNSK